MKKKMSAGSVFLGILCVIGWAYFIAAIGFSIKSVGECAKRGCNSGRAANSQYCYTHDPFIEGARMYDENQKRLEKQRYIDSMYSSTSSTQKKSEASRDNESSMYKSSNYSKNKTYDDRYLINDPDDFDDPDEYADDAWGIDFDTYDEAYDYWEDW